MKQFEEMNEYDREFKSMNNKINLAQKEQEDILYQINNKIGRKSPTRRQVSPIWKYYLTLTVTSLIIIILSLPLLTNIIQDRTGNLNNESIHQQNWEVSPTFKLPVTFGDGTKGEYVLVGKEEKLGFLVGSGKEGEAAVQPIVKGKANKYMWHFWGSEEELNGDFKVVGINETGEREKVLLGNNEETVWNYGELGGSNNGADKHIPSSMVFPTSGLWKLEVYIGDKMFDEVIVHVQEN
ncbi:DUF4871 domain-containing protein [Alteribacillus sp. YIM 98480]|uniref:DUF4871 domain-containing protein n=1 Tax=Alteribacillus sp. YIM 98480 TaxID=2606599 RepID=UPI00131BF273|nr:DUF4871 domain-containing protein [Alteribacillus sp. YIM 98480]